ncbi:MAG: hypothetical protein ACLU06_07575 [Eggerthellaceae bacterium]
MRNFRQVLADERVDQHATGEMEQCAEQNARQGIREDIRADSKQSTQQGIQQSTKQSTKRGTNRNLADDAVGCETQTKECPVCHARCFADMPVCYGCLHVFAEGESVDQSVLGDRKNAGMMPVAQDNKAELIETELDKAGLREAKLNKVKLASGSSAVQLPKRTFSRRAARIMKQRSNVRYSDWQTGMQAGNRIEVPLVAKDSTSTDDVQRTEILKLVISLQV